MINNRRQNYKILANIVLLLFIVTGCVSETYKEAENKIQGRFDEVTDLLNPAHVIVTNEAYVDNRPIFHDYHPRWTESTVVINAPEKTKLRDLMSALFKQRPEIQVVYQDGVDPDIETTDAMDIEGNIIDVVKKISRLVNYHYVIEDGDIIWVPRVTKLFQLGILPGNVTYDMGGDFQASGKGKGGNAVAKGKVSYKNSREDVWKNLKTTLDDLKSDEGEYTLGENNSILTVVDRPNNINLIADFVKKFNKYHLQQVGIKVQVLEVDLNEEFKRGIDWTLIRDSINNSFKLDVTLPNVSPLATISAGPALGAEGANFIYTRNTGKLRGSTGLIQYIEQQGNVSLVSEPRFTILNNQVAEIKILDSEAYAEQTSVAISGNANITQADIKPGHLVTGFSLFVVPTIFDKEVLLQLTTSISRKVDLASFTTNNQTIQLPEFTDRRFTQRSVVPNNATLVVTGFKGIKNSTGDTTSFKIDALGTKGATNDTTEIVMLITPVIIRG